MTATIHPFPLKKRLPEDWDSRFDRLDQMLSQNPSADAWDDLLKRVHEVCKRSKVAAVKAKADLDYVMQTVRP